MVTLRRQLHMPVAKSFLVAVTLLCVIPITWNVLDDYWVFYSWWGVFKNVLWWFLPLLANAVYGACSKKIYKVLASVVFVLFYARVCWYYARNGSSFDIATEGAQQMHLLLVPFVMLLLWMMVVFVLGLAVRFVAWLLTKKVGKEHLPSAGLVISAGQKLRRLQLVQFPAKASIAVPSLMCVFLALFFGTAFYYLVMPFSARDESLLVTSGKSPTGVEMQVVQARDFTGLYRVAFFVRTHDDVWTRYDLADRSLYWRARLRVMDEGNIVQLYKNAHRIAQYDWAANRFYLRVGMQDVEIPPSDELYDIKPVAVSNLHVSDSDG